MSTTAPATRLRRPGTLRSLRLGELTVTYVPDGAARLSGRGWLPDTTDEDWAAHPEYLDADGYLTAGVGGLLVERGERALLIDAGVGPEERPSEPGSPVSGLRGGALLENLAALGRRLADIEAVALTHLHADHLGWVRHPAPGGDRPAFAHAPCLLAEPEWRGRDHLAAHGIGPDVLSVLEPHVRTLADGAEIFPGVRIRYSPGHTPGHASYVLSSGGRRLIAFGDALHSPVQIGHPEWYAAPDHDRAAAVQSRRRLVAELQQPDTLGFGIHFADVVFGRVRPGGAGPVWEAVDA
ncbi:MBL fold metallo-hydrolase [Streptomyces sp. RS10V-4]|uniref:MBL fold metallo-hydrolase n=1 Tax=Streptomyces rhizoryzae TaxID=2932493 RepID=UPI002004F378|nr:MBL fold metallo-hydrolase [Streptomyces rhizoryzae]MCK7622802.1 MBL fold metallo-hydrolase [Streptomyces rhizoryzae]